MNRLSPPSVKQAFVNTDATVLIIQNSQSLRFSKFVFIADRRLIIS